eukprot:TRINITY_DN5167_c0_g1_i1.p1 TRINITY_DN5167_c0_g1~~TRINITY_DN5167_c0_g1_i1.p1  ORF type:complete len:1365 (-),score=320.45 TRINITY_DN5167_c0_g1_i1:45-4139(-)
MEGAKVYVKHETELWRKAVVVGALGGGKYRVELEWWEDQVASMGNWEVETMEVDASMCEGGSLPFQNANMPETGFPNMTTLDHLHEAALLHNLRVRFFVQACPYTYTADIVIAVNPYRWFPHLFNEEKRKEYLVFDREKLAPHVYSTSSRAYAGLQEQKADQSILVSGESGAGKTETVKIMLGHLAFIASSDDTSHIRRIVESNPLLESFGNAQTVRNDNSSRFGKFIELELNKSCKLSGSRCRTYLLEKSRVVGQDAGERNYHILYQMLATDVETRGGFCLGDQAYTRDSMRYTRLGASKTCKIEGRSDADRFDETMAALALVGVEGALLTQLLRSLASVLLLGQVEFKGSEDENAKFAAGPAGACAATALGVSGAALEKALTYRSLRTRDEIIVKGLTPSIAVATRDALAKELYARVFDWLVVQICGATAAKGEERSHFVGLLDIFGFESFAINRFEQLCINFANEKLQQKFTLDVFKSVQQEYSDEGIPWDRIEFKDNSPILGLIEAKLGIIAMLNEEGVRPKGSDANFVSKLATVHKDDKAFSIPKLGRQKELQFSVAHYAGTITYTTEGWLERNKDSVSEDVLTMMRTSDNDIIKTIFEPVKVVAEVSETKGKSTGSDTVATKFKNSLAQLMETIGKTATQYVRCIKPNKIKSDCAVDNAMVVEQLRCAGVIEAIRVSRAGFPARLPRKEFVKRFGVLANALAGRGFAGRASLAGRGVDGGGKDDVAKRAASALSAVEKGSDEVTTCRLLLSALAPGDTSQYEIGRTRVYFKTGVLEVMEERRALLMQGAATEITRIARGRRTRKIYVRQRRAALRLETAYRMLRKRRAFRRTRALIVMVQALRRATLARREALQRRRTRCATRLQAVVRGRTAMKEFIRTRRSVIVVQSAMRRISCRRQYVKDLAEFKEQAKLENQVKALQQRIRSLEAGGGGGGGGGCGGYTAPSSNAPSAEVLEALEALANENARLRVELEHVRADNIALRRENKQLRAGQSIKSDWLTFITRSNQQEEKGRKVGRKRDLLTDHSLDVSDHVTSDSDADSGNVLPTPVAAPPKLQQLQLHPPLTEFWENVPCDGIPILESGTEVHLKLGKCVLMLDDMGKSLIWRALKPEDKGYTRSMAFLLEKRTELRASSQRGSISSLNDISQVGPAYDNNLLGVAFAIRSALTGKYVVTGGLLAGYCLQATGDRPEDAAVFTFVPLCDGQGAQDSHAAEFSFAVRLLEESRMLQLRKDNYVDLKAVSETDFDKDVDFETMAVSFECLLPCTSYELFINECQIGITVGKDLPLRIIAFKQVSQEEGQAPGPGPAELTGRVHLGDVIAHVDGQDISGVSRYDALSLIACKRPVTLGFEVYTDYGF